MHDCVVVGVESRIMCLGDLVGRYVGDEMGKVLWLRIFADVDEKEKEHVVNVAVLAIVVNRQNRGQRYILYRVRGPVDT